MPIDIPKNDMTEEEMKIFILDIQEKYNNIEKQLEEKIQRELNLIDYNNKLFSKLTQQKENVQSSTESEENIPSCISKEIYDILSEKEKEQLNELLEEE